MEKREAGSAPVSCKEREKGKEFDVTKLPSLVSGPSCGKKEVRKSEVRIRNKERPIEAQCVEREENAQAYFLCAKIIRVNLNWYVEMRILLQTKKWLSNAMLFSRL
jgi:hypothetical protein